MRRTIALPPFLAMIAACSDGMMAPPRPAASEAAFGRGVSERTVKTRALVAGCATRFALPPAPPGQEFTINSECHFRGIGRLTGTTTQVVTFTGPGTVAITNTTVYTAHNGDQLEATFVGTGTLDQSGNVCFSGTETFTGGTGRFQGASGSAQVKGCASLASGTGFFVTKGSILVQKRGSDGDSDHDSDSDSD